MKVIPTNIIAAAQASQAAWKVPASVSIAQWAWESAWGTKMTGRFNPFGIKAKPGQPHSTVATHEVVHGQRIAIMAAFRDFDSMEEAFDAHAELLATADVYQAAMHALPDVETFVRMMAPHYATDPNYAASILGIIAANTLRRFDGPAPAGA